MKNATVVFERRRRRLLSEAVPGGTENLCELRVVPKSLRSDGSWNPPDPAAEQQVQASAERSLEI